VSTVREARRRRLIAARRRRRSVWLHRLVAAAAVAVTIAVLTAGPQRMAGNTAALLALLSGIPQHGNTLGQPTAPVTVTEYGDLTCPIGREFARGSEAQLISDVVASGRAKLVYRGFETTSATANAGEYAASQIAARAAGLQDRAWYYILLFYDRQRAETTRYVTDGFMRGIAAAVPGLNLAKWRAARRDAALAAAVIADGRAASAAGVTGTPAIFVSGRRGTLQFSDPNTAVPTLPQLRSLITRVS
jgi:protein-disulfide isomerase